MQWQDQSSRHPTRIRISPFPSPPLPLFTHFPHHTTLHSILHTCTCNFIFLYMKLTPEKNLNESNSILQSSDSTIKRATDGLIECPLPPQSGSVKEICVITFLFTLFYFCNLSFSWWPGPHWNLPEHFIEKEREWECNPGLCMPCIISCLEEHIPLMPSQLCWVE